MSGEWMIAVALLWGFYRLTGAIDRHTDAINNIRTRNFNEGRAYTLKKIARLRRVYGGNAKGNSTEGLDTIEQSD